MSEDGTKAKVAAPVHQAARTVAHAVGPGGEAFGIHGVSALTLQRSAGNRAVANLVRTSVAYPTLQRCSCSSGGGKCAKCQHDDEQVLRRSAAPGAAPAPMAAETMVRSVLSRPGHPLDAGVRQDMEGHFGTSLGGVRVHTDSAAAESAEAVEAHAYTVGQHIVFGASTWSPHSSGGRHLLAHELAHTIQQRGAKRSLQPLLRSSGANESIAEREAEGAAQALMRGGRPALVHRSVPVLRRKRKKKGGAGRAAKAALRNEAAGGCGMCYGKANLGQVGTDVHDQVLRNVRAVMPHLVDNEELRLAGATNFDIPDLFEYVAERPGATGKMSKVGELKPDSENGRAQGVLQMARYRSNIAKLPLFRNTRIEALTTKLPDGFDFADNTSPAGCPKQRIRIRHWKNGIYLYRCIPPWKQLVKKKNCKCPVDKEEEEKKKKKKKDKKQDKKKDNKKSQKVKSTPQKEKPAAKKPAPNKPAPKKPAPKKAPKLKGPGAKAFSLTLGIGLGSSSTGAANVGVGISVNSTGMSAGTVGASVSYDSDGNAIAAVGASASKDSSSNIAGGAGATAANKSSATGAGVASVGTAKDSDVMGAGVASKGSADKVTGTGVGKATSGDAKDVDVKDAKSGTATPGKSGEKSTGQQGKKEGEEAEAGESGTPGTEGDVRNSPEFKQAQAEAKKIEAAFAKATPAQQKLMAELVKKYPDHVMPVPNEAFVRKWLNATSGVKDQHVDKIANEPWAQGTDIDEAEFKRRVDAVIAGKTIVVVNAPPSPDPPPKKQPQKKPPPKQEAKPAFRSIESMAKDEGKTKEDLRTQLQAVAKAYKWSGAARGFRGHVDTTVTGPQTVVLFFNDSQGKAAAIVVLQLLTKKGGKGAIKILDASDAVTADGKVLSTKLRGEELGITFF